MKTSLEPTPTTRAIAWYRAHQQQIASALPLTISGVTRTTRWPECFEAWIAQADTLPPALAEAYICRPLRSIKEALSNAAP